MVKKTDNMNSEQRELFKRLEATYGETWLLFEEKWIKPKCALACYIIGMWFEVDVHLEGDPRLEEANELMEKKIRDGITFGLFEVNEGPLRPT
jgi:hypothetical protein